MCKPCGEAYEELERAAGHDYAQFFLWEETPYPFGAPEDVAPKLRAEAERLGHSRKAL